MNELVFFEPNKIDAEPFTTSEIVGKFAKVKHHAIQQLISKHESDFREFGVIAFEMRKPPLGSKGGRPETIYRLNEEQATLLMTYLKNTEQVRAFKKELVRQFYAVRKELLARQMYRAEMKPIRREMTDVIKAVDPSPWAYKKYTDLAYKAATGRNAAQLRKERDAPKKAAASDYMTADEVAAVARCTEQIAVLLDMGLDYGQVKSMLLDRSTVRREEQNL